MDECILLQMSQNGLVRARRGAGAASVTCTRLHIFRMAKASPEGARNLTANSLVKLIRLGKTV